MPMFLVFGIVKSLPSVFFSRGVEKLLTVVCRVIELRVTCGICSELTRYLFGGSNHRLACQRSMCRLLEGCCNVSKHAEVCVCVEREKKSRKLGFWEPGFFYTFFFWCLPLVWHWRAIVYIWAIFSFSSSMSCTSFTFRSESSIWHLYVSSSHDEHLQGRFTELSMSISVLLFTRKAYCGVWI